MKDRPLISILTNTYNRANIIHRCIESIQHQTFQNYEHIIVDGNSTDDTEYVVKAYNDPHIKYIKLSTRGPQVQMKAGFSLSTGKYITFLDDDDEYLPEKLEKQLSAFESEPSSVGLVYCWMAYYNNDDPDTIINVHKPQIRGYVGDIAPSEPIVCGTPTMMVRREVFESIGGCYNDSIGFIGSDWELAARICQVCDVDYIPEILVKVYINHGFARLSDDFYTEKAQKGLVFHNHFLTEFNEVFQKNPKLAHYHYQSLCDYCIKLGDKKRAWRYYWSYITSKPSLKIAASLFKRLLF